LATPAIAAGSLGALAHVRTLPEAMARFRSPSQSQKTQLMIMFMEVKDKKRRR
jgi:hypothetical protein